MSKNNDKTAMVVPVKVDIVIERKEPEVKKRVAGMQVLCPKCRNDAFVTSTRAHPVVISIRMRYYKCGNSACGHTFKA